MSFTTFGHLNENPLVRTARYLVLAGIAGGILAIATALPGVDIPGEYDAIIIGIAVPALIGLEKKIRDWNASNSANVEPPA